MDWMKKIGRKLGARLWNTPRDSIKEIELVSLFKRHLESYMISQHE